MSLYDVLEHVPRVLLFARQHSKRKLARRGQFSENRGIAPPLSSFRVRTTGKKLHLTKRIFYAHRYRTGLSTESSRYRPHKAINLRFQCRTLLTNFKGGYFAISYQRPHALRDVQGRGVTCGASFPHVEAGREGGTRESLLLRA